MARTNGIATAIAPHGRGGGVRARRRAGAPAAVVFAFLLLTSGPARAVPVGLDALFFAGPGVWGLDPASAAPRASADTSDFSLWLTVGQEVSVEQALRLPILSNPQESGGNASASDPFVAESEWTLTNESDSTLVDVTLLVLRVAGWQYDVPGGTPESFPASGVGADLSLDDIEVVSHDGGASTLFFFGLDFGTLAPGESATRVFRYVIAGDLPLVPDGSGGLTQRLPQLGASVVAVPEPTTLALVVLGMGGLAALRRGRRR